jgi:hypothetical protein
MKDYSFLIFAFLINVSYPPATAGGSDILIFKRQIVLL